ncbi:MAG: DUF5668 domain-containing protein [Candidatus Doudnabacteria bacterium]
MFLGLFLVILGALLLFKNLGLIVLPASVWSILYPVILIVLGLWLISIVQRGRAYKHWMMNRYWGRRDDEEQ